MTSVYTHQTMTKRAYAAMLDAEFGERDIVKRVWTSDFYLLEYLNSPLGLIVYAHHGMNGCEAFYPASIDFQKATGLLVSEGIHSIAGKDSRFVHHMMGRKTTGFLVHAAYGRMVDAGDPEAPSFEEDFNRLEVTETPTGLTVAAIRRKDVYVIRPAMNEVHDQARLEVQMFGRKLSQVAVS